MLNRVEAVIRAFDPCLSCATHAIGSMPLEVQLVDSNGTTIRPNHPIKSRQIPQKARPKRRGKYVFFSLFLSKPVNNAGNYPARRNSGRQQWLRS